MADPCNVLLQRKRQLLAKEESVCGTFESMTATDGKVRVLVGQTADPDIPLFERDLASSSLSRFDDIPGEQMVTTTVSAEIVGSGTPTTAPETDVLLRGCGLAKTAISKITTGAVSVSKYTYGETVTGTGGGSGRFLYHSDQDNGGTMYYEVISGALLDAETLTGGTSGSTSTSSSSPSDAGFAYNPTSDSIPTISLTSEEDGYKKSSKGCNGNLNITWEASKPGFFEFEFSGVLHSFGDGALTSGIDYYATEPPVLANANLAFDEETTDYSAVISSLSINLNNTVTMRRDANKSAGYVSARITGRRPTATLDPEMTLAATYDFFNKFIAGTNVTLSFQAGSTAGNTIIVVIPNAQFDSVTDGERDGVALANVEMKLNRDSDTGDDEIEILFV